MFRVDIKPQRAAVTRSLSPPPDCATTAGAATGVMAAPERSDSDGANSHRADSHEALQAEAAETIRRELSRLTALLRRHFSQSGAESLLPALADTSNTEAAAGARAFLTQIRTPGRRAGGGCRAVGRLGAHRRRFRRFQARGAGVARGGRGPDCRGRQIGTGSCEGRLWIYVYPSRGAVTMKVAKWGNSLAVRIPSDVARA
jgi:hypothetical protein